MPYTFGGKYGKKNGLNFSSNKYLLDEINPASAYSLRKLKSTATRSITGHVCARSECGKSGIS